MESRAGHATSWSSSFPALLDHVHSRVTWRERERDAQLYESRQELILKKEPKEQKKFKGCTVVKSFLDRKRRRELPTKNEKC